MKNIHSKHIYILLGLILLALVFLFLNYQADKTASNKAVAFGVSYSPRYAKDLGLDPKQTYSSILDDLNVKYIRLSAYWDEIEPKENQFEFSDLDWYVSEANKRQAQVILAIGYKLPRWPECRAPRWLDQRNLSWLRERQLLLIDQIITHFNQSPNISAWQLENEPFFNFGVCPPVDSHFFQDEVKFVKAKTQKPIIVTDTGELSFWIEAMQRGDIFGTTLYRVVEAPIIGEFHYPVRPYLYRIRSDLSRSIFARNNQGTIISELQAEGWAAKPLKTIDVETQIKTFSLSQFMENVGFARKTGFSEAYLWGVEWWYYLNTLGHPEYLKYAKTLF